MGTKTEVPLGLSLFLNQIGLRDKRLPVEPEPVAKGRRAFPEVEENKWYERGEECPF